MIRVGVVGHTGYAELARVLRTLRELAPGLRLELAFEPELQRTICVDIRYVLFIIDKFAGARHLVDEMTIVKSTSIPVLEQGSSLLVPVDATIDTNK